MIDRAEQHAVNVDDRQIGKLEELQRFRHFLLRRHGIHHCGNRLGEALQRLVRIRHRDVLDADFGGELAFVVDQKKAPGGFRSRTPQSVQRVPDRRGFPEGRHARVHETSGAVLRIGHQGLQLFANLRLQQFQIAFALRLIHQAKETDRFVGKQFAEQVANHGLRKVVEQGGADVGREPAPHRHKHLNRMPGDNRGHLRGRRLLDTARRLGGMLEEIVTVQSFDRLRGVT